MSFIANIISAVFEVIIEIITVIVEIIIQIVEIVLSAIMSLLGFDTEQTVEYYEVHNIKLFDEPDSHNQLGNVVAAAILTNSDIAADLIYASAFRSIKGNLRKFTNFIEDGDYFEGFPDLESAITYVEYVELAAALAIEQGEACTPEQSYVGALDTNSWIRKWLQDNTDYDVGANVIGSGAFPSTSTSPGSTSSTVLYNMLIEVSNEVTSFDELTTDLGSISESTSAGTTTDVTVKNHQITITDEVATSDAMLADTRFHVDFGATVYNEGPDTYTITVYNDAGVEVVLPYTVPSRPTGMHYISYYYANSAPARQYIFVYQVGTGTYPDLDDPENPINIDATVLQCMPAIPLRISNDNYTTFPAAKQQQIEDLCKLVSLDAEAVLDSILDDPDVDPGDLDHIYINFGVRMWDTSQAGMGYLFKIFLNLYPAQGVTKGLYDAAPASDDKPVNNVIVTTDDYKFLFQFNYVTYEHFTVTEIDADSGSVENGIYYSDMSRFSGGDLVSPYYVSSGKGTYNVGYKADTLAEVALFLAGSGVVNPGTTTGEATNWMQVTARMRYTLTLNDPDGSVSSLLYLTPDLVYENASGTLQIVPGASEETTSGQSITYYYCDVSGLDAYTVAGPIGALKVVDGDTGNFRMVKFNLGAPDDLMVPFIYNFVDELSNREMTQLFLAGTHASIYIAHFEIIETSGFGSLLMIVFIIILIVVAFYVAPYLSAAFQGTAAAGGGAAGGAAGGSAVGTGLASGGGAVTAVPVTIAESGLVTITGTGQFLTGGVLSISAPVTGIVSTATVTAGIAGVSTIAWAPTLLSFAIGFIQNQIIKAAITMVAKDEPELAVALSIVASVTMGSFNFDTMSFNSIDFFDVAKMFGTSTTYISRVAEIYVEGEYEDLSAAEEQFREITDTRQYYLDKIRRGLMLDHDGFTPINLLSTYVTAAIDNPMSPPALISQSVESVPLQFEIYNIDGIRDTLFNTDMA
jgi:hypothetical protein